MAKTGLTLPRLLILNQMAGPMTWELAEDAGNTLGCVAVLTGHPDTLAKGSTAKVQLHPAPAYVRGSFAVRAWSWLRYVWKAFFWLWRWPKEIPVLLFSNPPILCWLGWVMKKLRGQRFGVMVHDIYPNILVSIGGFLGSHFLIHLWYMLNRHAYENAEVVMTLGEYMAANLEKQFDSRKTRPGKVEVIYPWVDIDKIRPICKKENWFAQKYDQVDKLTVMYSGNMGLGHDMETMLAAAKVLQDEPKIHFMFIGAGPKWNLVAETIEREDLTNVTLLPWQPEENLPNQLACADIGLVSLEKEMNGLAIPSKALYTLSAGSGLVLISSGSGEIADGIANSKCGWQVQPGDIDGLSTLLRNMQPARLDIVKQQARETISKIGGRKENVKLLMKNSQWIING